MEEKKSIWQRFKELLSPNKSKNDGFKPAYTQNGAMPYYSNFGESVYASDTVQQCISAIAKEMSKLQPQHIRIKNGCRKSVFNSPIARILRDPHPNMTTHDFIEKITRILYIKENCYIYAAYDGLAEDETKRLYRNYTALYPLNPRVVTYLENEKGDILRIRFEFAEGKILEVPYEDVIHLRLNFALNDYAGGDQYGKPNNEALLTTLKINHKLLEGLSNGIETSQLVNGIVKYNTMLSDKTIEESIEEFNRKLATNKSGIIGLDMKTEYTPVTRDIKISDKETLDFLDKKVSRNYGVSQAILDGTANADVMRAFYQLTLEPLVVAYEQAFTKVFFTKQQISGGNKVIFYNNLTEHMNNSELLERLKLAKETGAITNNQFNELALGLPPYEGGDVRYVSLNWAKSTVIDNYQLQDKDIVSSSTLKEEPTIKPIKEEQDENNS